MENNITDKLGLTSQYMKHPTGSPIFDDLLDGGYEHGIMTVIYGPAGSGKSNAMHVALTTIEKKAIFVDTEGSFSVDRLKQLTPSAEKLLDNIVLLKATSLEKQGEIIEKIPSMLDQGGFELIIVDGIATQYRAAISRGDEGINNELSKQINTLYGLAMQHEIPVLVTSQVYADLEKDGVKVVGGDIIKYSAKCMIELQHEDGRKAILRRHRSLPESSRDFVITNIGIYEHD